MKKRCLLYLLVISMLFSNLSLPVFAFDADIPLQKEPSLLVENGKIEEEGSLGTEGKEECGESDTKDLSKERKPIIPEDETEQTWQVENENRSEEEPESEDKEEKMEKLFLQLSDI